ncbi:hypothetical protein OEZ86_011500 [Tetradesmus obliquus]|nr:hypothetical protein OEZ86_011485 [Tetradesmus obliquus]WIA28983.1 hypothetical protein OEZ86_011500 [Tetradesmus obliquus]
MVPSIEFQQKLEAALCCNLFLLGAQGAEGAQQLDLSEKLFRSKNNKALELILYHCHSVINGKAAAKKLFNRVWPISDMDTQQRKEFYKRAETWLKESGHLEHHGNSLQQLVRNPFGFKVVSFLCDLTHCALKVQHERMFPSDIIEHADIMDDSLLLALAEPLLTAARAENQLQVERMLRLCQEGAALQQQAEEKAGRLRDLFYSLTAQLKEARAACETTLPPEVLFALLEGTVAQGQGGALGARHSPPPTQLPGDVREQQQQLQQLWAQLEGHIQEFDSLAGLVQGLAGSDVHPHAIDGAALRAAGQLPGAHSTAGLDIAAMMEAWLVDVGAVCRYIRYLAGQPDADLAGSADVQQPGTWGSAGGSAAATGSRGSSVCPLVATSDASSHAPHLYAQLEMHRNCLDHMRSMQSAINQAMAAEGKRIQQLEPQVYGLMAAQQDQCMEAASVMGAAEAAGQHDTFQFDSMQQGPAKGQAGELGAGFGASRGSLFGAAAAAAESEEVSPLVTEAAHLDPMGPVPGSDMSSAARPRRLTFAAAVHADSPSLLQGYSSDVGSPTSSGGSVAQGCDSAASSEQRPAVQAQEQAPGQLMSLLRQRFAKVVPN